MIVIGRDNNVEAKITGITDAEFNLIGILLSLLPLNDAAAGLLAYCTGIFLWAPSINTINTITAKNIIITSGNGFVDTLMLLCIMTTEIVIGIIIALYFVRR